MMIEPGANMPITLIGITVGTPYNRHTLLTTWGLASSDSDDNLRCFYNTGTNIAVFITEQNVGHPRSDRTYVNWLADDTLKMEVHEKDHAANDALRRAGFDTKVGLFFRQRIGTEFTYLGTVRFTGAEPFNQTKLYQFALLECSNARALV